MADFNALQEELKSHLTGSLTEDACQGIDVFVATTAGQIVSALTAEDRPKPEILSMDEDGNVIFEDDEKQWKDILITGIVAVAVGMVDVPAGGTVTLAMLVAAGKVAVFGKVVETLLNPNCTRLEPKDSAIVCALAGVLSQSEVYPTTSQLHRLAVKSLKDGRSFDGKREVQDRLDRLEAMGIIRAVDGDGESRWDLDEPFVS